MTTETERSNEVQGPVTGRGNTTPLAADRSIRHVGFNEITDLLIQRPDESLGSYYARTGAAYHSPTEATVDYVMAHFELPADQRPRIQHLTGGLMRKLARHGLR